MASSGSSDFDLTRVDIINAALRKVGAVAQGESATAEMLSQGSDALNVITKNLEGFRLWTRQWWTKTFSAASEVTGTDALVYTCIRSHTSADADKPITGANYKSYWKQTGSTGGVWATSTAYSAIGEFQFDADVIGMDKAFLRYSGYDIPLAIRGFAEYMEVPTKDDFGEPSILFVEDIIRKKGYLWPQPINTNYILNVLVYTKLEDFDAANNNPDFLTKWLQFLIYAVAADLGPEYGINIAQQRLLDGKAELYKMRLFKEDSEVSDGSFIKSCY
jgi:hypothetical protein